MPHEIFTDLFLDAMVAWQRGWKKQKDRRIALTDALLSAIQQTHLPTAARPLTGSV